MLKNSNTKSLQKKMLIFASVSMALTLTICFITSIVSYAADVKDTEKNNQEIYDIIQEECYDENGKPQGKLAEYIHAKIDYFTENPTPLMKKYLELNPELNIEELFNKDAWKQDSSGEWIKFKDGSMADLDLFMGAFRNEDGSIWLTKKDGTTVSEYELTCVFMGGIGEEYLEQYVTLVGSSTGVDDIDTIIKMFSLSLYKTNAEYVKSADGTVKAMYGSGVGAPLWVSNFLNTGYGFTKTVGITLMVLYFIMGIISDAQISEITAEQLIKKLIGLAIAVLVINHLFDIIGLLAQFGDALMNTVRQAGLSVSLGQQDNSWLVDDAIDSVNHPQSGWDWFWGKVGDFFSNLFTGGKNGFGSHIMTWIFKIAIYCIAFSRVVELYIRVIFAPIGVASIVEGGMHSPGVRYIKKIASLCIQGSVVVMCLYAKFLIDDFASSGENPLGFLSTIVTYITLIGVAKNSGKISDDIVGI